MQTKLDYRYDPTAKTSVRVLKETPSRYRTALHITNLQEQKENFLCAGVLPKFVYSGSIENVATRKKAEIRFDFLPEARLILERVQQQYGSGDRFLDVAFGARLNQEEATGYFMKYLKSHNLDGWLNILWTNDLNCSGKMMWHGPNVRFNKPEARKFTLCLKSSEENIFLREHGIKGLADHEIGTHFFRLINDGLQPWFSNRQKFGLRFARSYQTKVTEEGLAAVHTLLPIQVKMLYVPALLYYTACKSTELTFKELFDHLATYICNPEVRWKQVMRVKRVLPDCNGYGGYGNDQVYFAGAVQILRQVNEIDFKLLYTGRICVDEVQRVKRLARVDCLKLPHFLKDLSSYKRTLNEIALLNGLVTEIKRPISFSLKTKNKKKSATQQTRNRVPRTMSPSLSSRAFSTELAATPHPPPLSTRNRKSCWRSLDEISTSSSSLTGRRTAELSETIIKC